jgi:hypothetical protein
MPIPPEKHGRDAQSPAGTKKTVPDVTNTDSGRPAREVDRVTALRGPELPALRMTEKIRRKLSERLFIQDSDLPYAELEESLRKMVLAVAERQDRLAEGLLIKLNDIEYRLDDLECGRHPDDAGGS